METMTNDQADFENKSTQTKSKEDKRREYFR